MCVWEGRGSAQTRFSRCVVSIAMFDTTQVDGGEGEGSAKLCEKKVKIRKEKEKKGGGSLINGVHKTNIVFLSEE